MIQFKVSVRDITIRAQIEIRSINNKKLSLPDSEYGQKIPIKTQDN